MNIEFHKIDDELVQVLGNHHDMKVFGFAHLSEEKQNRRCWHYDLTLMKHPKRIKRSNPNDRTISTLDQLEERVKRILEEESK